MSRQPFDRYAVPDIPVGYPPQLDGAFSVILPEATVNLCTNPSFELGTTGHAALNGAIAQSSTKQRRGVYSLGITPNASVEAGNYFALALTAGQPYAFSVDVWGEPGKWYNLYVADTSNNRLSPLKRIQGTGYWERIGVVYYEAAGATRRFFITRSAYADTNPFYTDGWQIENKDHVTSYTDGDLTGFVRNQADFGWSGTPHASTSWRSGQTKAGGLEMNLKTLGLTILSVIGLGIGSIGNVAIPNVDGGSYYQTSVMKDRQFTIAGQLNGLSPSLPDLQRTRRDLMAALDVFNTARRQPLLLTYQLQDEDGNPVSEKVNIKALYNSGLGGQYDNDTGENVGIQFDSFLPLIVSEGEKGASLTYKQTVANANYIIERDRTGVWKSLGGVQSPDGTVDALAFGPDGTLYAGGIFANSGGAATPGIAKWDGTTWTGLTTGVSGASPYVYALAFGPDGSLYVGGDFTLAGGVANTAKIAKWDGSAWSALGTGMNGVVRALAVGPDGTLYAGGDFTLAGGVANTVRIAKWNGAVWSPMVTGVDGMVRGIAIQKDVAVYIVGSFSNAGAVPVAGIAKWNGAAFSALGTGLNAFGTCLTFGLDGTLYAGGTFTLAGGVANTAYIARWNGTEWLPLATGANNYLYSLYVSPSGLLYAGGIFTNIGGRAVPDGIAAWNGSAWVYVDSDLPTTPTTVYAVAGNTAGDLYLGFNQGGSAITSLVTTITNLGTAKTYPKFTFTGPGTVYQVWNVTTGKTIYFNLVLNAGETATLNLDPSNFSFVSSFRGNIRDTILRGSDLDFYFQKGDNLISVFVAGSTTAATKVTDVYRESYSSLDGTIR